MARIRTIKPSFFKHSDLFEAERQSGLPLRLAYQGLWCVADREGRFKWRPREIKLDVLPYDDVDFSAIMEALAEHRFILRYKCAGIEYGHIPSFREHQHVNPREAPSVLPEPGVPDARSTRKGRVGMKMPTDPLASKRPGHIYLALARSAKHFKVGFAEDDPHQRVKALSAGSAEELELIESFPAAFGVESEIHRALRQFHARREWFVCSADASSVLGTWFTQAARVADACSTRLREELVSGVSGIREGKGREGEGEDSAKPPIAAIAQEAPPLETPFVTLPTNIEGEEFPVFEPQIAEFEQAYPAVDVCRQLRAMRAWAVANKPLRKTAKGMLRFINSWLAKEQNKPQKPSNQRISAHDKGTLGLVQFVANAERSADATDLGGGAGTARNPLPANGHGPAQMADDGRRFLVRLPALDGPGAPGSVPPLPHKP